MNNADMPAMPFSQELTENADRQCRAIGIDPAPNVYKGLSKREAFAMHAMSGMLANTDDYDAALHADGIFMEIVSKNAVEAADALLKALETE